MVKIETLDLEEIESTEKLAQYFSSIDNINIDTGYTRAQIESVESIAPGSFTDVEEFSLGQLSSHPSRFNSAVIASRVKELKKLISERLDSEYESVLKSMSDALATIDTINIILKRVQGKDVREIDYSALMVSEWLGDKFIDLKLNCLINNSITFRTTDKIPYAVIDRMNYSVNEFVDMSSIESVRNNEYDGRILKHMLEIEDLTFDNILPIFSKSDNIRQLLDNINSDIMELISEMKNCLTYSNLSDETFKHWIAYERKRTTSFKMYAEDKISVAILTLVAIIRYDY